MNEDIGNISAMSWKIGSETLRGYAFMYDGLSRLTAANYLLNNAASTNNSVSGISYDKHGNMRSIQRRGKTTASAYGVIDNLTMTYSGNQLTNVADAGTTVTIAESNDFKKGSSTNPGYAYNKNGAMTKDLNKNISSISYNFLNLPARVSISGVHHDYTYAADGRKLKVVQGSLNRDYVGGIIYENSSLKRILIDGGYIEGTTYYYYLNDHQGNIRVVASGSGTIHQRNHYYPFGMPFADTSNTDQDKQPYKYGGKEYERANGLKWFDFESRQMDPALGSYTTMDPLAEKYYGVSPYVYCGNNPVRYVDPDGRIVGTIIGTVAGGISGAYQAHKNGSDVWAGAAEGAVAGAITGAAIDVAVAATVASGGGALVIIGIGAGAGAIGGATGAVAGDVTGQVVDNMKNNNDNFSDAINNISTDNFASKATNGAISGAVSGLTGGALGAIGKTAGTSTQAVQQTMSQNITSTATTLTSQDASQGTVNAVTNSITKGMGTAGANTTNSMIKMEAVVSTITESYSKVIEDQLKNK